MRERPIVFTRPMVRAILDGRKTQERQLVKPQPQPNGGAGLHPVRPYNTTTGAWNWVLAKTGMGGDPFNCPYGVPGDRLWVKETWSGQRNRPIAECELFYRADGEHQHGRQLGLSYAERESKWRPSIFMPRWASRLTLEVKAVRVERLQKISEKDAISEGIDLRNDDFEWRGTEKSKDSHVGRYAFLWNSINAKRGHSWESNPWVWVVEFKRVTP